MKHRKTNPKLPKPVSTVRELKRALGRIPQTQQRDVLGAIFMILYVESDGARLIVNQDKEWTVETVEEVAAMLRLILTPCEEEGR